mmetsp:Transcript_66670/g.171646  ORF Transcript_66670/g.171646 Transcript_66670/m.171646 type:complete len:237 (-) Transcript_66670:98-808(-)
MFSSCKNVWTSFTFRETQYSSNARAACFLKVLSASATLASISANSGPAFARPALRRFSGNFVSSDCSTSWPVMQQLRSPIRTSGAFGASIAISSQVQKSFSKLLTRAGSSSTSDLRKPERRSTSAFCAASSLSTAARMASTPNSSASEGQSMSSSRTAATASSREWLTKYSRSSVLPWSWNFRSDHSGGNSLANSSSLPKLETPFRAGRATSSTLEWRLACDHISAGAWQASKPPD